MTESADAAPDTCSARRSPRPASQAGASRGALQLGVEGHADIAAPSRQLRLDRRRTAHVRSRERRERRNVRQTHVERGGLLTCRNRLHPQ